MSVRRDQEGAVSIEALGLTVVLLAALTLIILIGSAYWNLTMLSTTASSAALAGQTLVNTDCSAARIGASCTQRAQEVVDSITTDYQDQLIFSNPNFNNVQAQIVQPSCSPSPFPGEVGGSAPSGWGYAFVSIRTRFEPIGGTPIPIRAASMATGYQPVCQGGTP